MKCMTVLRGGVCHRTSSPHKSWNKMKRKKKKSYASVRLAVHTCMHSWVGVFNVSAHKRA